MIHRRPLALLLAVSALSAGAVPAFALQQPVSRPDSRAGQGSRSDAASTLVRAEASSHPVLSRRLTLELREISLENAFKAIAAAADVAIAFSSDAIPDGSTVTLRATGQELRAVLRVLTAGRGLDILVSNSGQLVVVSATVGGEPAPPTGATGTLTGVVTGGNGWPIAGAAVNVVGTARSGRTDAQGRYTITGVPAGTRTVRASFAGYAEASDTVTVPAGEATLLGMELTQEVVRLDEVIAIGYASVRRRDLTGSIATVVGDQALVRAAPTTAVPNTLQGRAAGVQVVTNSGAPGSGASVRIRGSNSIAANSEPLYVVDGIPFGQGSSGTDNPLATVDPSNIEAIQVLKDASATAIYGARGANGVVLITTRRGARGGNQVQVESSYGLQRIAREIDVLDSRQFMTMANEANLNAGRTPRYTQVDIDTARTYDYLDMVLRTAEQHSHAVTLSGGDQGSRFLLSGSYLRQEGVLIETDFERYGGRLNLDRDLSPRFRVGTSLSGTQTIQNIGPGEDENFNSGVVAALNFAPYIPPRDATGKWNKLAVTSDQTGNPVANQVEIRQPQRSTRILASVFGEFDLAPGLRLRSNLAGNLAFHSNLRWAPRTVSAGGAGGVASRDERQSREVTSETTIALTRRLGPGSFDALAGASIQTAHAERTLAGAQNFPVDDLQYDNLGAGSQVSAPFSGVAEWTLLSFLGRANYNLLDRYLFTVTARRDGSSRFGENNKWAVFPSAAFAWRLIDEPFLQGQGLFSDLKLRLSYGRTGNQAINEYESLAQLVTVNSALGENPAVVVGLAPAGRAPNPDLKWETQAQANLGVDAAFLDHRVALSLDLYRTRTSDLLLLVTRPAISGHQSQLRNVGSVRNEGVELSVSTVNVENGRLSWHSTLNLSTNRNRVLEIGAQERIVQGSFLIEPGRPLSTIHGYRVLGLYQEGDACPLLATRDCAPGEYRVQDTDGNGTINAADRVVLGHADPDFYGGLSNSVVFGPLSLDAALTFSVGNEVVNITKQRNSLVRGVYNERTEVLDRWTPDNTRTRVPRANADRPSLLYSTLVEDASFLRLQTLTLGYRLPPSLLPFTQAARVYLTGQNLWLATRYTGFDPEVNRNGGDARQRGLDNNGIPRPRVWNLGASVTF